MLGAYYIHMLFSYDWLQSFFNKKLPAPQKLAELLTLHFAEVEKIKKEGKDYLLDIDIRPNRAADCFSHQGVAREISVIADLKLKNQSLRLQAEKPSFKGQKHKAKDFISVEVKDKTVCPRYSLRIIEGIKVNSSPKWLKERLKSCGLRPINNIVDIVNYVMLETGQPLHAFDAEKLEGGKIIVRYAMNREKLIALDEQRFELDSDILVIADGKKPIAIAGIKGGKIPEVDKKTKIIILESANFNSRVIRKSSKKLNLKTDASIRFEHGIDPNLTEGAINRAAMLIQKNAGGSVYRDLIDFYPVKVLPKRIKLDLNYLENLLGIKIPEIKVRGILIKLGMKIENEKSVSVVSGRTINVIVPTFRLDISIPEDLIEEVGRIYGYDKIKAVFPLSSLVPPQRNFSVFWRNMIKDILKQTGFTEVYNYSFFGEKEAANFGYDEKNLVKLINPLSQEQKYLRASLIPGLLKNLENNLRRFPDIMIFEMGKVFSREEKIMLSGIKNGEAFYQLKGTIDLLLNRLGIADIWYNEYQIKAEKQKNFWWHPKKIAEIRVGRETIGFLGEISAKTLDQFQIKSKVVYFDIFFEKLVDLTSEEHQYRPISRFPSVIRDIAILVPREVKTENVLNVIEMAGGKIIRDIDLFDIYEGEGLPAGRQDWPSGKKNFAFHIIFQSENRTLRSEEIDVLQKKIISALEKKPDWEVRK